MTENLKKFCKIFWEANKALVLPGHSKSREQADRHGRAVLGLTSPSLPAVLVLRVFVFTAGRQAGNMGGQVKNSSARELCRGER